MKQLISILSFANLLLIKCLKQLFAGEQAEITVELKGKKIIRSYRIIKN
jgi:hypothetical protein